MSFEDHARATMERAASAVQAHVEEDLRTCVDELIRIAAADRERVKAEVEGQLGSAARGTALRVEELLQAVRGLDSAKTLGDVLGRLEQYAAAEVDRAVVLIVKGDRLHEWRSSGFGDSPRPRDVRMADAGLAGVVARSGQPTGRPPGPASENRQQTGPPFGPVVDIGQAVALPVRIGGTVVAVLYADALNAASSSESGWWPAFLELMARHASRVLEVLTISQAATLSQADPMAQASHSSSFSKPVPRSS